MYPAERLKVSRDRSIAVFGATGHTGRFVLAELLRQGFKPLAIARDVGKLAKIDFPDRPVETRVATTSDPASLDQALIGASAVINCAGPFLDTADPIIAAALRAGIPYLDVTAEQASALATFEQYTIQALEKDIIIAPAMGFYGALGDLMVTAAMENWERADEIHIAIALNKWWPTQGTRLTGQRNTVPRVIIAEGKLAPLEESASNLSWDFPTPFGRQEVVELPFTETILISRHLQVSALRTYLNLAPLNDLRDEKTPPPTPSDETGRSAQTFLMDIILRNGLEERRAIARGRDIYAFTAPLVVEAARRILDGAVEARGVLAPGKMFDAQDFLRSLVPEHLMFEVKTTAYNTQSTE